MEIKGYKLVTEEKYRRVLAEAKELGKEYSEDEVIAYYDKLGGLILDKEGFKVETGTFYDFVEKKIKAEKKEKVSEVKEDVKEPVEAKNEPKKAVKKTK